MPALTRLDHIVLICRDIKQAIADYSLIFGRGPIWQAEDLENGIRTALFPCENTALELVAPVIGHPSHIRISELLCEGEGSLTSLAFESDDLKKTHYLFSRRGLEPSDISTGHSTDIRTKIQRSWKRFRCADEICTGVKTFVLENEQPAPTFNAKSGVGCLDHLVINTPNPDRAIAHYGARLGLRFALDRTIKAFKTRFMFFRIGGLTIEVIHRLDQDISADGMDTIWGLTWAVDNLETEHSRLDKAGLSVSDIRTGRKPGSRVFTLKNGNLGIPTLFIAHDERE